jgi:hypothetical protein
MLICVNNLCGRGKNIFAALAWVNIAFHGATLAQRQIGSLLILANTCK